MSRYTGISPLNCLAVATALAVATGCSYHQTRDHITPLELSGTFSSSGEQTMDMEWWQAFKSPELDDIIDKALTGSFEIEESYYRIMESQALVRRENSSLWPSLDLESGYRIERPETSRGDILDLGFAASYELDLWGRVRSAVEAEQFQSLSTDEDYQTAALSLSAEVARIVFQLITVQQQTGLLQRQLEINNKVLESLRNRFGLGQGLRGDILQQQQLIERTRSDLIDSQSQEKLLMNQLATLSGIPPGTPMNLELPGAFPELPPMPSTGVPAQLLQRRPDVRAQFNRLMAADRDWAVTVAERFPRISISGSIYSEDTNSIELFDDWVRTLIANLTLPIMDAGRRRAEVERADSVKMQQLSRYAQVAIEAIREVEDAIIRENNQQNQLENISEQVRLAEETYLQVQRQYMNGISDYLEVLTALTNEQRLRRQFLTAKFRLYENRIAMYRALAGRITPDESGT